MLSSTLCIGFHYVPHTLTTETHTQRFICLIKHVIKYNNLNIIQTQIQYTYYVSRANSSCVLYSHQMLYSCARLLSIENVKSEREYIRMLVMYAVARYIVHGISIYIRQWSWTCQNTHSLNKTKTSRSLSRQICFTSNSYALDRINAESNKHMFKCKIRIIKKSSVKYYFFW